MSVPDYYNRVNPDLLRLIPPDARIVVEVGCGAGALADAYRRINPHVRYLGIEKEPEPAKAASVPGRIDRVITGDAADVAPSALGLSEMEPSVDCLVFGDVLEHMVDPWAVLTRLASWVRDGGQVLACVPNIQHYSVLVNLLRGKWEYQDQGLLDRTHLRFFTLDGMRDLFARAGLQVFEIQPRWWAGDEVERFGQLMAPVLKALAIEPASFATQTRAVQFIVRAIRSSATPRRMVIWSLVGSPIGSEVRVGEPSQFLATIPGIRVLSGTRLQFDDLRLTWLGAEKVFLQQRVIIPLAEHLQLQRALLANGYLIVGEVDDDPTHFPGLASTDYFALRSCHCLQTTSDAMAEALRRYNPHVTVFANHVASLPARRVESESDTARTAVTIFLGALNREEDWAPLMAAINRVLNRLGDLVHVQVVYDRAFFDALATSRKAFEPLCAYNRYHELLHAADVALLPLEPTQFNQHKSDLKFIECAAHSVVTLASPTVYGRTIVTGETGLIYHSPDEFGALLESVIRDAPLRRRIAENAYRYVVEKRILARHFRARHEWYRQMLERRGELEAELHARTTELSRG